MAIIDYDPEFLENFKEELRNRDIRLVAYEHVLAGGSRILSSESYLQLRTLVADRWRVHPNDIIMVGSGKLGFSLNPDQYFAAFHKDSDFDLAILSGELFDSYWRKVHRYTQRYRTWKNKRLFFEKLSGGWIRPDLLPTNDFAERREWWDFFDGISNRRDFGYKKIRAGVYKSWDFLEVYHLDNLAQCRSELQ